MEGDRWRKRKSEVIKSLEDKLTKLITKHDDLTERKVQLLQRWINLEKGLKNGLRMQKKIQNH